MSRSPSPLAPKSFPSPPTLSRGERGRRTRRDLIEQAAEDFRPGNTPAGGVLMHTERLLRRVGPRPYVGMLTRARGSEGIAEEGGGASQLDAVIFGQRIAGAVGVEQSNQAADVL